MKKETIVEIIVKAKIANNETHNIFVNINDETTESQILNLIKESLNAINRSYCTCENNKRACHCNGGQWDGAYKVIEVRNASKDI